MATTDQPTHITPDDLARINRALGAMPYLPLAAGPGRRVTSTRVHAPRPGSDPAEAGTRQVDQLVGLLVSLAEVLTEQGEEHRVLQEDHRQLLADRAALRRLLGTA